MYFHSHIASELIHGQRLSNKAASKSWALTLSSGELALGLTMEGEDVEFVELTTTSVLMLFSGQLERS